MRPTRSRFAAPVACGSTATRSSQSDPRPFRRRRSRSSPPVRTPHPRGGRVRSGRLTPGRLLHGGVREQLWMKDHTPPPRQFGTLRGRRSWNCVRCREQRRSMDPERGSAGSRVLYLFPSGTAAGPAVVHVPHVELAGTCPGCRTRSRGTRRFRSSSLLPARRRLKSSHGGASTALRARSCTATRSRDRKGSVYFVVELPEGAHNIRSVRAVR